MQFITDIEAIEAPFAGAVITIGNFDGVHLGHKALFREVIERARKIDGTAVAITFEPHPMRVLRQTAKPPLITLAEQKRELIMKTGIDVLVQIPFTKTFASMAARDFLEGILVERMGLKVFVVGGDYGFGKNREGNLDFLRGASKTLGFELVIADWIQAPIDGIRISSTRIREAVADGDLVNARKMLGRHYQIRGRVVHGRNRGGKLLNCPTANMELVDELVPKTGVYAVTVEFDGVLYQGVANIGYSPTFDDHVYTAEVHILDFKEDIYGRVIRVNFIERLRDEEKYDSLDPLIAQIRRDILDARQILDRMAPESRRKDS